MTKPSPRVVAIAACALMLPGCDVRIGAPRYLWLLWLVPLLLAFYVYSFRTKARLLKQFASHEMVTRLASGISPQRQKLKAFLVLLGFTAAILSLAQFRFGFVWEDVRRKGVDIVVALDLSDSMLVQDAESGGKLTRLERAKRDITDLLRLMDGDRVALVAFAGAAFIECPLTLDYSAASIFLDDMDTDLIPVKGTALGDAIRMSLKALEGAGRNSQTVILITDGEDQTGEAQAAAEDAKKQGVRIFTIGIGRDEGAPVPEAGGGFHHDVNGELALSRLDEAALEKIALTTGGRYVRSVTGAVDMETIYKQGIKTVLQDQELGSKRRQRWEERFQWWVGLALLALALEPLLSERAKTRQVPHA